MSNQEILPKNANIAMKIKIFKNKENILVNNVNLLCVWNVSIN